MARNPGGRPPGLIPDGPKIRRLRVERGIPVGKLAAQLGRHRESISRVEHDNRPISDVFASQLAWALTAAGRKLGLDEPDIKAADILKDPRQLDDSDDEEEALAS